MLTRPLTCFSTTSWSAYNPVRLTFLVAVPSSARDAHSPTIRGYWEPSTALSCTVCRLWSCCLTIGCAGVYPRSVQVALPQPFQPFQSCLNLTGHLAALDSLHESLLFKASDIPNRILLESAAADNANRTLATFWDDPNRTFGTAGRIDRTLATAEHAGKIFPCTKADDADRTFATAGDTDWTSTSARNINRTRTTAQPPGSYQLPGARSFKA
ncbi:hypothetical protein BV25DRAFT_938313 [Artomyces pyxidatus]|uniref:Uncharacterized protein n=1 Tax=Artomyces pyxidatus TaxID=48021 RepID=A0ACB8SXS9_9AGAM|nr:hypothetical protein BV25DRAFT_938313 [Artomyces pyxidatus]